MDLYTDFVAYKTSPNGRTVHININTCPSIYEYKNVAPEQILRIDFDAKGWRKQTLYSSRIADLYC